MSSPGPTVAERVRTVCARATRAHVVADGRPPAVCRIHHLLPDGSLALTVGNGSQLAVGDTVTPVVLELLDHGPSTIVESVRALVWIRGQVRPAAPSEVLPLLDAIARTNPDPALLEVGHDDLLVVLTVESIVFADSTGAALVDHSSVLAARPDPFCQVEWAWVHHLQKHHPDMVERLRLRLPRGTRRGRIYLVGLDRFGLQVRIEGPGPEGHWHHRIPFFTPVTDDVALCRELRSLMAHAAGSRRRLGDGTASAAATTKLVLTRRCIYA